jgi:cation-transporting ATPase 13A3/4/5
VLVSPPKGSRNGGHFKSAPSNLEIACLKTYPFDSAVQRMTVVTKKKGAPQFDVYVKGAPEKVASLCKPETVPVDFAAVLQMYTKQGLRVIAASTKSLNANARWKEVDSMTRGELEEKCDFLGLIIMQNLVKKETYGAIQKLHEANIETVMVTGDNILTAINVGRDCKLVKPEQTVVKVEADLVVESYSSHLNVSYTIEDESPTNVDVI